MLPQFIDHLTSAFSWLFWPMNVSTFEYRQGLALLQNKIRICLAPASQTEQHCQWWMIFAYLENSGADRRPVGSLSAAAGEYLCLLREGLRDLYQHTVLNHYQKSMTLTGAKDAQHKGSWSVAIWLYLKWQLFCRLRCTSTSIPCKSKSCQEQARRELYAQKVPWAERGRGFARREFQFAVLVTFLANTDLVNICQGMVSEAGACMH